LIAVQRQTPVSGLLTWTLERLVEHEDAYAYARRRHLEWLKRGADLGTVRDLWQSGEGCLSIQLLQEFCVHVTQKVPKPLPAEAAA